MRWTDLLLFNGGVYGLSWLITQARATRRLREFANRIPVVGELVHCIVCTGFWVAIGMLIAVRWSSLLSVEFRQLGLVDGVLLTGLSVTTNWIVGRLMGDVKE